MNFDKRECDSRISESRQEHTGIMSDDSQFQAMVARHRELPHYRLEQFIEFCKFDPTIGPDRGIIFLKDDGDGYLWVPQFQFYAIWPTDSTPPYPPKLQPVVKEVNLMRHAYSDPHGVTDWWIRPHRRITSEERFLPDNIRLPVSTKYSRFDRSSPAALIGQNDEADRLILLLATE